ncbi:hypothetical protein K466DRAFT_553058 [Polyporus arcularius HHB13444]|uniref:Uncharacterized protein n=1 Tax=Polyporus arcularius HHB13444 TaxID=1314778 RepID=A0A5C3P6C2_9APHY|nr:hypothetical protein K466DRAFT_553058 [Polyporus arcularius HHB13444]
MGGSSISLPKSYFVALFVEAILHGVYTVLFIGTMYLLLLSTVHIALSMQQNLIAFFDQHAAEGDQTILNDAGSPLVYCQIAIEVINDSIVCWRTWVLWGRSYRVIAAPVLCIVGGLACGVPLIRAFVMSPPGQDVYSPEIIRWFSALAALTCVANLYAISAISYKACLQALRTLRNMTGMHGRGYHRTILLIFIESGAVYSIALIVTVILFESGDNAVYVISDMIPHLTGIYPTGIIVLVSLNMTFHDDMIRIPKTLTSIQCVPGHSNSLVGSGNNETVLRLRADGFAQPGTGQTAIDPSELDGGQAIELQPIGKSHAFESLEEGPWNAGSDGTLYGLTKAGKLV